MKSGAAFAVDNDEGISTAEAGSLLNKYMECSQ